jgi:hypothetical protein
MKFLLAEQDKQAQHFQPLVVIVGPPPGSFEIGHTLWPESECPHHVDPVSFLFHQVYNCQA